MPDAPAQSNPNPGEGANPPAPAPGATPPAATPPASNGEGSFDPAALTPEQLNQVLEKNPHIWKTDRLAELRDKSKKFDEAQQKATEAETKALEEQGKFKELSEKQSATIEELQGKLKTSTVNQAVTNKLAPLGVVDLEAALALIDRSKIEVAEDGSISGVDEAIEALKTGKAYLFNAGGGTTTTVGTPSNPGNGGGASGPAKFKRSQLQDPKFYNENKEAILKAHAAGEIEDDLSR